MAIMQESLYRQSAFFSLLIGVLLFNGYGVGIVHFWLVPLIIINCLMIVVCSFIGAYAVCFVRDFSMIISLGMTFLLFTSGIFWDVHDIGDPQKTEILLAVNPLAFIIDSYRQILMYQTPPDIVHMCLMALILCVILVFIVLLMRKTSQYLALKALTT
jgi:lipopolysaccharide transport system permease protein